MLDGALVAPYPGYVPPCTPVVRKRPPAGDEWLHEIAHEGHRAQAHFSEQATRVFTDGDYDWCARMPTISASVAALPVNNIILDGMLTAVDGKGQTVSFDLPATSASAAPTRTKARLVYYAFDLLYLDGFDLRGAALIDRKRVLQALLESTSGVQLIKNVEHIAGVGDVVLAHACKLGLGGIISKRANAPYHSGRCTDWVSTKCPG
jgi:bifunctional non-homologous end joining protein LigD